MDTILNGAPLDKEGFALTDRWYCEETCTYYPTGTTVREIKRDADAARSTWAYPYTVSTIRHDFVSHGLQAPSLDECVEICEAIELKIDDELFDWALAIYEEMELCKAAKNKED